ncbi:MAG: 23S rRNA (cytidine1920-2'-O)/16S rRNA (cytidine1409-2'-O)-methyltransferase [Alphaproteobacteria bacterium]|jgi:23S rRNA (cytidine1920-2'-O)/16S rRNA (cytidine1409-2'-O)-methyltransferase
MRIDAYLVERDLVRSRVRAKALIVAGKVQVNGKVVKKASHETAVDAEVVLLEEDHHYVSRSAFKLKGLLDAADVRLKNKIILDIGSSTGGFTQVSLEYGAAHVYAVDVGTDQLHESLRGHKQITSIEQTDARDLSPTMFPLEPSVLVVDLSFISLDKVIPTVIAEIESIFEICCLVKPQFEVGRSSIDKKGLVTDEGERLRALSKVEACLNSLGFEVIHDMEAALHGGDGNIEYMVYAARP